MLFQLASIIPRRVGCLGLLLAGGFLVSVDVAPAHAESAADYRFIQLTDHALDDKLPRVSPGSRPKIVWAANFALPGSKSTSSDAEIMMWDGLRLYQMTDDHADDMRPVVNSFAEIAWMKGGLDAQGEIYVRYQESDGALVDHQVTNDFNRDRYPDINDSGTVTWGRSTGNLMAVYELGDTDYTTFDIEAYRPHINTQGHITFAGRWIRNRFGFLLEPFDASTYGYHQFRRAEINDLDQLLIEAIRDREDLGGPQDMLFWDGAAMRTVYESDVYVGRGDLNNNGIAVFEGKGGLPGTSSSGEDLEIFVFRAAGNVVFQLTDNDVDDLWPTVTDDGTILWQSKGIWEGATRGQFTGVVEAQCCEDLMAALPLAEDLDADGVPNLTDNCPVTVNPTQADELAPFGVGDACDGECQGFMHVRDCNQAEVLLGTRTSSGGCSSGGGNDTAAMLALVVLVRLRRRRRAPMRNRCLRS